MVSRLHYMHISFTDFDAPTALSPPQRRHPGVSGTPGRVNGRPVTPVSTSTRTPNKRRRTSPTRNNPAAEGFARRDLSPLLVRRLRRRQGGRGLHGPVPFSPSAISWSCSLLPLLFIMRPPLPRTPAAWGHLAMVGFLIQGLYFALGYLALAMDISSERWR